MSTLFKQTLLNSCQYIAEMVGQRVLKVLVFVSQKVDYLDGTPIQEKELRGLSTPWLESTNDTLSVEGITADRAYQSKKN